MLQLINNLNLEAFKIADAVANPLVSYFMKYFLESYLIILPLIALYLYLKRDKNLYSFAFTAVLLYMISDVMKVVFKEPRPCALPSLSYINQWGCEPGYSFPSDHAAVLSGLPFFLDNYKYLRMLYVVWLILNLFGKIYLGEHYLTDIIGGAIIGVIIGKIIHINRQRINDFMGGLLSKVYRPLSI